MIGATYKAEKGTVTVFGTNQQVPVQFYNFTGVNCTIAVQEPLKKKKEPAEFLELLDLVPNHGIIRQLTVLDDTVRGAAHLMGETDCITDLRNLFLFNPKSPEATARAMLHGWAHIAYLECDVEARAFQLACQVEAAMLLQEADIIECWAELFSDLLVDDAEENIQHIASTMPLRAMALMQALSHLLARAFNSKSSRKPQFDQVISKIKDLALPRVQLQLPQLIKERGALEEVATRLIFFFELNDAATLSNLTSIDLSHEPLNEQHLAALQFAAGVERLDLTGTKLGLNGLSIVLGLSKLKELRAAHTQVEELKGLNKMPALARLDVSGTRVRDTDLLRLEGLSTLQFIDVSHTAVTESGLNRLRGLIPGIDIVR